MKNLIIVGAGGLGRTIYNIAIETTEYQTEFVVKGFLDDDLGVLESYNGYPPLLGSPGLYVPEQGNLFVNALGGVASKRRVCEALMAKGAVFATLIHPTARIGTNARIGKGTVIAPFVSVGPEAQIGDFVLVQTHSIVAHDVQIGDWARIDTHVVCVGGIVLEDEVSVHTGAIINHKVVVERGATVGAGSFVIRRVKSGTTVHGNPAKKIV